MKRVSARKLPSFGYLVGSDRHSGGPDLETPSLAPGSGSTNLYHLRVREPKEYARLHVTRNYFLQPIRYDFRAYDRLLNLVTDADQHPTVLRVMAKMLEGYQGRVFNRPEAVLGTTRDQIARRLAGLPGLIVPQTIAIDGRPEALEEADLRFPAILRLAGTHMGEVLGVVENRQELAARIVPGQRHFITRFHDYRSSDGLYRKYRFYWFGDTLVFRHMFVSDQWNVHQTDRARFMIHWPDLMAEEKALLDRGVAAFSPRTIEALGAIRAETDLDFFGIDCAMTPDGELIIFEVNATMNFFPVFTSPEFAYVNACLAPAQAAFDRMLFGD